MSKFYFFNDNEYYVENDYYLAFENPIILDLSVRLASAIDNLFFHFGLDVPWVNLEDAPEDGVLKDLIDPFLIIEKCDSIIHLLETENNPIINKYSEKTENVFDPTSLILGEDSYLNSRLILYFKEIKKLSSENLKFFREN